MQTPRVAALLKQFTILAQDQDDVGAYISDVLEEIGSLVHMRGKLEPR